MNLPTIRQMQYFAALAAHNSFSRAAKACHVTQSTLSAGIRELESVLGAPLVDRSKRGLSLTPLGEEVLARARQILEEAEELVLHAHRGRRPLTGRLRLGVIPTVAPFFLPRALPALIQAYPDLKLYLREDVTARLVTQLEAGDLDVVLMALPYTSARLRAEPFMEDRFVFAYRDESKAVPQPMTLDALRQETVLLLEDGHCLREHAIAACALSDPGRTATFGATSLHTLVYMVNHGLGVTLLPEMAVESGITAGTDVKVRRFAEPQPSRQIGLVWRKGAGREAEYLRLLSVFQDEAAGRAISPADGEQPASRADAG